jgi:Spy/CpxP family protein refolding chaperone
MVFAQAPKPTQPAPAPTETYIRASQPKPWIAQSTIRVFMPPSPSSMQMMCQQLGLKADQLAKANDLVRSLNTKIENMTSQSQPIKSIMDELKSSQTDPTKLQSLVAESMKQEQAIAQAEMDMWMEFKKLLTPDQQKTFWTIMGYRYADPHRVSPLAPPADQAAPSKK